MSLKFVVMRKVEIAHLRNFALSEVVAPLVESLRTVADSELSSFAGRDFERRIRALRHCW